MIAGLKIDNKSKYGATCKRCGRPMMMAKINQEIGQRWASFDPTPVPRDGQHFFRYHWCPANGTQPERRLPD